MNDQCDVIRLDAALDGDSDRLERAWAARHLDACDRCQAYAMRRRAIEMRLSSLPATMTPARPLWDDIALRVGLADPAPRGASARTLADSGARATGRSVHARTIWRAAAALALFTGGYAAGISKISAPGATSPQTLTQATLYGEQPADAAEEVQRLGSAWTAALARLGTAPGASPSAARLDREVALATMRGATAELARIAPDQPGVAAAYGAIREEHEKVGAHPGMSRGVTF